MVGAAFVMRTGVGFRMSSEISYTPWNPALMPNASKTATTECTSPTQASPLHLDLDHNYGNLQQDLDTSRIDTVKEKASEEIVIGTTLKSKTDRNDSPYLHNTDLPTNNCDSIELEIKSMGEKTPSAIAPKNLKTELKGQAVGKERSQSKHNSTMSFTRTVSEDVTWTDDEIDFDWNLHSTEKESLESKMKSDQANSRPQAISQPFAENQSNLGQAEEEVEKQDQRSNDVYGDDDIAVATRLVKRLSMIDVEPNNNALRNSVDSTDSEADELKFCENFQEEQCTDQEFQVRNSLSTLIHEQKPLIGSTHADDIGSNQVSDSSYHINKQIEGSDDLKPADQSGSESNLRVLQLFDCEAEEQAQHFLQESYEETIKDEKNIQISKYMADSISTTISQTSEDLDVSPTQRTVHLDDRKIVSSEDELAAKWREALSNDVADDDLLEDDDDLLDDDDKHNHTLQQKQIDPATLFGSDDEGFLDNKEENSYDIFNKKNNNLNSSPAMDTSLQGSSSDAQVNIQTRNTSNQCTPTNVSTIGLDSKSQNRLSVALFNEQLNYSGSQVLPLSNLSQPTSNFSLPPNNHGPNIPKARSFANMSKGGYSSPYDLPMDVVPKKRMSVQSTNRPIFSGSNLAPTNSSIPSNMTLPPKISTSIKPVQATLPKLNQSDNIVKSSQSNFFEDLPISSKPKTTSRRSSLYNSTPRNQSPPTGTGASQSTTLVSESHLPTLIQQHPVQPIELQPKQVPIITERINPHASLSSAYVPATLPSQNQIVPPNPPQTSYNPVSHIGTKQYVPQNNNSHTISANTRMHYPRTSSPLAQFNKSQNNYSMGNSSRSNSADYQKSLLGFESKTRSLSPTREVDEGDQSSSLQNQAHNQTAIPDQISTQSDLNMFSTRNTLSRTISSPSKYSFNNTSEQNFDVNPLPFAPPQRPKTQSPKSMLISSTWKMKSHQHQRSASFEPPILPNLTTSYSQIDNFSTSKTSNYLHREMNYVIPNDGRELDPLQRWKGSPVFAWGVAGSIVYSFPKDVPQYRTNDSSQMILRYPGEIKIQNIKDQYPLDSLVAQFPGPLRNKSKKKDVIAWLTTGIELLESDIINCRMSSHLSGDNNRLEERIMLWKIIRIFIEHDGNLEGSPDVQKSVSDIISPGLNNRKSLEVPLYTTGAELLDFPASKTTKIRAEAIDPATVDKLKIYLSQGERVKAVWEAVDKRLWAHAILISNTVSQDLYKQVIQEFVQKEVRIIDDASQPLAFLYEIFAGNFEESIDELVPPSARAGFQMVSTSNDGEPSQNASTGLDKWRESLNLVLNNRNAEDARAMIALGNLLTSYGRVEAAHICFIFARNLAVFNGIDDPLANFVLIGSDHQRQPFDFDRELESILISEIFDYGLSLSNQNIAVVPSPHLTVYKLYYAKVLAEHGFREKALNYCEVITASTTSQSRRLPYHHDLLISEVEDLTRRLKRSPSSEPSSWISKPSIDKAKGTVWATFNKFVVGEESNTKDNTPDLSVTTDLNPFSKVAGGTSIIGSSPSSVELPSLYTNTFGMNNNNHNNNHNNNNNNNNNNNSSPVTVASSRYAPGSTYQTQNNDSYLTNIQGPQNFRLASGNSSSEHNSYEPQRSIPSNYDHDYFKPQQMNMENSNLSQKAHSLTPQLYTPYEANLNYQEASSVNKFPSKEQLYSGPNISQVQITTNNFQESILTKGQELSNNYEAPISNSYKPLAAEYEPLLAIKNDNFESHDNLAEQKPSLDDESESTQVVENLTIREKSSVEKNREADEAFRRAAEADESIPAKKGWGIASWFGGGTKKNQEETSPNKPIRAKLGEASSFVYDPELKRWVNKKAGVENVDSKTSTPPPPKAVGPPRSMNMPPNSRRQSTITTSSSGARPPMNMRLSSEKIIETPNQQSDNDPASIGTNDTMPLPPMSQGLTRTASSNSILPPSRPGTSMSNASSIDDLLGPPSVTRRSGAKARKKGRGYVDVMSDTTNS
ncbi:COPII coat assembly protein sec16 [Erysiphe neolycopersici]|uniref:Protein transport protein sec16 n=1 Tax=Erysiphe neolycopersici TaxID=212602 RepID=A0A420I3G9_9PEZI|nr:COPII coat assembly protein sec16 [Erysiphe neolycopersici]